MSKKAISVNLIYQTAYQVLLVITPLITAPYISRILGPDNNGIYSYSYSIVTYFVVFASLGIDAYGNRIIAQNKIKGKYELDRSFSSLFWMHSIVSVLVIIAYFCYVVFWSGEYQVISWIQSIWLITTLIDINWLFFGLEEFKLTVIRNFVVKLSTVLSIFLFVKSKSDLWVYALIMGLGPLISNIILWGFIKRYVNFVKVSWKDVFSHLKPLLILFLAVIATSIYRLIDKVMLGWTGDMSSLASYEYADKMIKLVITLITALGTVMLPRMSMLYAEGKENEAAKYMKSTSQFMFVMSFALAFGLAAIADEFMPTLLGPGYEKSVILTKVLCISLPIMGWNNLIRTQVLMPKEKDGIYTKAVWAGAIINIALNYFFILWYGAIGAAIATIVAYAVVGIFQTYPISKEIKISTYLKNTIVPLISGVIMYLCVRLIATFFKPGIGCIIMEIVVGAIVYLTINIIHLARSNNEVFLNYLHKIKTALHFK